MIYDIWIKCDRLLHKKDAATTTITYLFPWLELWVHASVLNVCWCAEWSNYRTSTRLQNSATSMSMPFESCWWSLQHLRYFLFLAFVCFCDVAVSTTMHTYEHLGERVSNAIPSCHISLPTLVFARSCWCQWMSPRNGTVQPAQLSGHICASDSGFVQRVMQSSPLQTFLKLEPFEKRCAESAKPLGCHVGRWW